MSEQILGQPCNAKSEAAKGKGFRPAELADGNASKLHHVSEINKETMGKATGDRAAALKTPRWCVSMETESEMKVQAKIKDHQLAQMAHMAPQAKTEKDSHDLHGGD